MALLLDLAPLRDSPPFRRLLIGLGISNLGSQLTVVAVGLQVYAITGSTLSVGVLGICALVPLVLLGLYGGALVDAYDRRRVALVSSSGLWVVTIALAVQAWLHLDSVLLLYALVAVQSAGFAVNNPARSSIIPRLVAARLLPAANVLTTIETNVALTVGPLLGALLVAVGNFGPAYTIDAVLFTAALWALWRLPDLPPETADGSGGVGSTGHAARRGFASVIEGLYYLTTRPNVRMTFVVDLIAMILAMPRVLFPAVGVLFLGGGATTTGVLSAAYAAGAILAGVFSGGLVRVRAQGKVIVVSILAFGASVAAFGGVLVGVGADRPPQVLLGALVLAMVFLALAGGADSVSSVFRQTILQSATRTRCEAGCRGYSSWWSPADRAWGTWCWAPSRAGSARGGRPWSAG